MCQHTRWRPNIIGHYETSSLLSNTARSSVIWPNTAFALFFVFLLLEIILQIIEMIFADCKKWFLADCWKWFCRLLEIVLQIVGNGFTDYWK